MLIINWHHFVMAFKYFVGFVFFPNFVPFMNRVGNFVSKACRYVYLHAWQYRTIGRVHQRRIDMVRERGKARVVFMAMSVPLWKYQHLYDLMIRDSRFEATIVISPPIDFSADLQMRDVEALRGYFDERGMAYVDFDPTGAAPPLNIKDEIDPDILFYAQPYEHQLTPVHDCLNFYDRLLCFYPYSFMTGKNKLTFNFHFHNLAWRLYYPNEEIKSVAVELAWNKGRNVRVVGHPNSDDFALWYGNDPWKVITDGRPRKRIIWAPHFSFTNKFDQQPRSNFLWMAHFMLDLAQRYKEHLQIAFKPHPRLLAELYEHPEWGSARADAYYQTWSEMENTQLETGAYVDLFMTSDAMIHDSASFVLEYLYTHKPVMFVSREIDSLLAWQTELSCEAFRQLYIGKDEKQLLDFVDNVVLGGDDPMRPQRVAFYGQHLLPPEGKSVAQNTLDDLVCSLGLDNNITS